MQAPEIITLIGGTAWLLHMLVAVLYHTQAVDTTGETS
jgi:hypothetical protein